MAHRLILAFLVAVLVVPTTAIGTDAITGFARVIDGDTIEISGQRIRLHGIDAPERAQTCRGNGRPWPCGREATAALLGMVRDKMVSCVEKDRDRYGRIVAVCHLAGEDLNAALVAQGWALAYRRYSMDYVDEEEGARKASAGLWQGQFVPPWEWRRGARLSATPAASPPAEAKQCCRICRKGKACGDSCISRKYTCRKPPGCACNAQ